MTEIPPRPELTDFSKVDPPGWKPDPNRDFESRRHSLGFKWALDAAEAAEEEAQREWDEKYGHLVADDDGAR